VGIVKRNFVTSSKSDSDLIPMINIIFLLLVFFMVAGTITRHHSLIEYPESLSESIREPGELEIDVLSDGGIQVEGIRLDGTLSRHLRDLELPENTSVTCRIDRNLPASALDQIILALRDSGIDRLQILTTWKG